MSRPIRGKMLDALAQLSDSLDLTPPDTDREDKATAYALHYLAGGTPVDPLRNRSRLPTVTSLALYLATQGCDISRPLLQNWLTNEQTEKGKERADLYRTRVKQQGAGALVERGLEVLEHAKPHESALAQAQAKAGNWVAERLDREAWGQAGPTTGVSIGSLHLHAALSRPPIQVNAPPALGPIHVQVERGYPTEGELVVEQKALPPSNIQTPPSTDSEDKG